MAQMIQCPVCGEMNPSDLEFCQRCQSRLQQETGGTGSLGSPIQPGQAPTKKSTAELEPILPQWLREAREKARQSAEDEAAQLSQQTEKGDESPANQEPDLLAGLQSQSGSEEEEMPDWLANITGVPAKSKKNGMEDEKEVRWVELGREEDESSPPPDVPASTNRITATQAPSEATPPEPLPPWLAGLESTHETRDRDELAEFLSHADEDQAPSAALTDLTGAGFGADEASAQPQGPAAQDESSDWLKNLKAEFPEPPAEEATPFASELPEWLRAGSQAPSQPPEEPSSETPDWLKNFASNEEHQPPVENQPADSAPEEDLPDWLKNFAGERAASISPEFSAQPAEGESSDLLEQAPPANETPAPAFTDDSLSNHDLDSLFTDMPAWLSGAAAESKPAKDLPPAAQQDEEISPADLPSWVRAMRPVESAVDTIAAQALSGDQTLETRGPLAGLQGVLPASPFVPSSKPRAYSVKLQAAQEQQVQAALLERLLETETKPEPISTPPMVNSARGLRWVITAMLLLIAFGVLAARTQIFTMPFALGTPVELQAAITAVEGIPENAPVLTVVDYEPATVGEMEAAASPLLDHVILLKHPRLTFISTSPTGSALAERLISGPLGGHGYQSGNQYADLGYLPGGLAGIRAFAQDPRRAAPLSINLSAAWASAPLQDVQSLSNFAMIILITDNAEAGRAWIEQAGPLRGEASLVIVSSAQAGPMLLPYYQSGQVTGLVNGLNSGAVMEQYNSGRPGIARRYWDAYSLGLFLAAAFIAIGGMWNLAAGLQARRAVREDK